jgi:pimeloyl-ACP methyl ester carboxylesterase
MSAVEGWIRAGQKRLEVRRLGPDPESAPTLVFLHEGLGCASLWRDFPERLAAATGMGALVFSRAGYGRSDACELPRPLDYLEREALDVLPELVERAALRDYHLVGHSDGGSIALVFAGSAPRPGLGSVITEAAHVFNEEVCIASAHKIRERYVEGGLRERLKRHHGDNVDVAFYGWNDAWTDPAFLAMNLEAYLPEVRVPCLVTQGLDDAYGTPAQVDAIEEGVSGPVVSWLIPNCGHAPHRDQPGAVLEAMTRFLLAHSR